MLKAIISGGIIGLILYLMGFPIWTHEHGYLFKNSSIMLLSIILWTWIRLETKTDD